jgi:hypothetical protein
MVFFPSFQAKAYAERQTIKSAHQIKPSKTHDKILSNHQTKPSKTLANH